MSSIHNPDSMISGYEEEMKRIEKNMSRAITEIDRLQASYAELLAAAKLAIGLYGGPPAYYRFDQLKAVIERAEAPKECSGLVPADQRVK